MRVHSLITAVVVSAFVISGSAFAADGDGDGTPDFTDNCFEVSNSTQLNSDADAYGDACDCDYDQNETCGFSDFTVFLGCFGQVVPGSGPADDPNCEESDQDENLTVGFNDFTLFLNGFGGAPGPGAGPIGAHKCVFDTPNSSLVIWSVAIPMPPFPPVGSMDIDCGAVDPATGKAECECLFQTFEPVSIPGIGYVCFTPGGPCPMGEIDCDGGSGLDVELDTYHNIGICTGKANCAAQCDTHCSGHVPPKSLFFSGCGGFCDGGVNDGLPCATDDGCPGGSCPGKDGVPHGNECQCDCIGVGGAPSQAGSLRCSLSANIDVEAQPPCGDLKCQGGPTPGATCTTDGDCGGGLCVDDVIIAVGTRCIPLTNEVVTSQIQDTNNIPGSFFPDPPFLLTGVPGVCEDLAASVTTGRANVGAANFFDSTIGDLATNFTFTCQ